MRMIPKDTRQALKLDDAMPIPSAIGGVDLAQAATRRMARRLLPFRFVLYIIAFLDRMNVSAAALQMPGALGFSDGAIGLGAGIFFLGYVLLEIPGAETDGAVAESQVPRHLQRCGAHVHAVKE